LSGRPFPSSDLCPLSSVLGLRLRPPVPRVPLVPPVPPVPRSRRSLLQRSVRSSVRGVRSSSVRSAPPSAAFARPAFGPLLSPRRSLVPRLAAPVRHSSRRRLLVPVRHSSRRRLLVHGIRPSDVWPSRSRSRSRPLASACRSVRQFRLLRLRRPPCGSARLAPTPPPPAPACGSARSAPSPPSPASACRSVRLIPAPSFRSCDVVTWRPRPPARPAVTARMCLLPTLISTTQRSVGAGLLGGELWHMKV